MKILTFVDLHGDTSILKQLLKRAKEVVIETEIKMKTKLNNYNGILIKYLLIRLYQIADSTS